MRSALHDSFRVTKSFKPGKEDARKRRWEIKGRPWGTIPSSGSSIPTWGTIPIVKFCWPSRERSLRLGIIVTKVFLLITLEILSIFSLGSEVSNLTELMQILRNSSEVAGPSVFSDAIGMSSLEKTF